MALGLAGGSARWPRSSEVEWLSAEELAREGLRRSRVVMMNEASNRLARCVRTRRTGIRILPAARDAGVRLLAMEALGPPGGSPPIPEMLKQPEMAELLATARRLGIRLSGYDADGATIPLALRTKSKSPAFSNWRDDKQAEHLATLVEGLEPEARLLVWAGNMHHAKVRFMQYQPTGFRFRVKTGIDPFVIDQTVTVSFIERRGLTPLLSWAQGELRARGGEAGFIWRPGMPRPSPGCDAWLLSLDNRME